MVYKIVYHSICCTYKNPEVMTQKALECRAGCQTGKGILPLIVQQRARKCIKRQDHIMPNKTLRGIQKKDWKAVLVRALYRLLLLAMEKAV